LLVHLSSLLPANKDVDSANPKGQNVSAEMLYQNELEHRIILARSLKAFVSDNPDVKSVLKNAFIESEEFEESLPYLYLRNLSYNNQPIAEWLLAYTDDTTKNLKYFTDDIIYIDPYLAICIKSDIEDDEDDMAENWNLSETVKFGFSSIDLSKVFELTDFEDEYIEWNDENSVPEGNYLFWGSFENSGYLVITSENYNTLDGGDNPFKRAYTFTNNSAPFEEECQAARDYLVQFLDLYPDPQSLDGNVFIWIVAQAIYNAAIHKFCVEFPAIIGNGGTIHETCDRNDRDKIEEIKRVRIPNKSDRAENQLRRVYNGAFRSRSYRLRVICYAIADPNQPDFAKLIQVFTARKKDFNKSGNYFDPQPSLKFFKWRLHEYSHKMKYVWIADSEKEVISSTYSVNHSGTHKFEENGNIQTQNVNVSTTINRTQNDLHAGESLVYYCDFANGNFGELYTTGMIHFNVRESF
jgi:hypothetical protein